MAYTHAVLLRLKVFGMLTSKRTMMVGRIENRRLVDLRTGPGIDEDEARAALSQGENEKEKTDENAKNKGVGGPG